MSEYAQRLRVSAVTGMLSVQNAITVVAPQSTVLFRLLDAYDCIVMVLFIYQSVDAAQMTGAAGISIFPALANIQLTGLYQSTTTSVYVLLGIPIGELLILLLVVGSFWREVSTFIHSQRLIRPKTNGQRLLSLFVVAFFKLILINFLHPSLWVVVAQPLSGDGSSPLLSTITVISAVAGALNIVLLAGMVVFFHLFFRIRDLWSKDALGSTAFVKNALKALHKVVLVAASLDVIDRSSLVVGLINVACTSTYLGLTLTQNPIMPKARILWETILEAIIFAFSLHYFLVSAWGAHSNFAIKSLNIILLHLLVIYLLLAFRRRREALELPQAFDPSDPDRFAQLTRQAVEIAEAGSQRSRVALLHDLTPPDQSPWFPIDSYKSPSGQVDPEALIGAPSFETDLERELSVLLEVYFREMIEANPDLPLSTCLLYSKLLFFRRQKQMLSLLTFLELERRQGELPPFEFLKEQFDFRKLIEEYLNTGFEKTCAADSLHILDALIYNETFDNFQSQVVRVIEAMDSIWNGLLVDAPEIGRLIGACEKLHQEVITAEGLFENLQSIAAPSYFAHRQYLCFLRDVLCDTHRANEEEEKVNFLLATKTIYLRSIDLEVVQATDDSQKQLMVLSGEPDNLGALVYVSADLCDTLGFQRQQIMGRSVEELMPVFMAGMLNTWMADILTGTELMTDKFRNRQEFIFLMTSSRHFEVRVARLRLVPNFDKGVTFAMYVTPVGLFPAQLGGPKKLGALVYDLDSEELVCFDRGLELAFGLTPKVLGNDPTISTSPITITQLFPYIHTEEVQNTLVRGGEVAATLDVQELINGSTKASRPKVERRVSRLFKLADLQAKIQGRRTVSIAVPLKDASDPEIEPEKVSLELLKQLDYGATTIVLLGIRSIVPVETMETNFRLSGAMGEMQVMAEAVRRSQANSRSKEKAASDEAGNQRSQKLLKARLGTLRSYVGPFVLTKICLVTLFFVILGRYFVTGEAQLTAMHLYNRRLRLLMVSNFFLSHFHAAPVLYPIYPEIVWDHEIARPFLMATSSSGRAVEIPLQLSATTATPLWSDSIYAHWDRATRTPGLVIDMLETFPLAIFSDDFTVEVSVNDYSNLVFHAMELFLIDQDTNAYDRLVKTFYSPLSLMTTRSNAMPGLFDTMNQTPLNIMKALSWSGLALTLVAFVVTGFFLRRIVKHLNAVYLLFAYLSDEELQGFLDNSAQFKSLFLSKNLEGQPVTAAPESGVADSERRSLADGPETEKKRQKSRRESRGPADSRDCGSSHSPSQRAFRAYEILTTREEIFRAKILIREVRLGALKVGYFLAPMILFGFLLAASFYIQNQGTAVYKYFGKLASFQSGMMVSRTLMGNYVFNLSCDDCLANITSHCQPLLEGVLDLLIAAFDLQSSNVKVPYQNLTRFSDNFCVQMGNWFDVPNPAWDYICLTNKVLSNSFQTVFVHVVGEMIQVVRNLADYSAVYVHTQMPMIVDSIVWVFEEFQKSLVAEMRDLRSLEFGTVLVIALCLFLASLVGYAIFWTYFIKSLERTERGKRIIIKIFQTKAAGNPKVGDWFREHFGIVAAPSTTTNPPTDKQ